MALAGSGGPRGTPASGSPDRLVCASLQSRKRVAEEHDAPTTSPLPGAAGAELLDGEDNSGPVCSGQRPYGRGACSRGTGDGNSRALGSRPGRGPARRLPETRPHRWGRPAVARCRVTHGSRDRIRPGPSQAGHASRVRAQAFCGRPWHAPRHGTRCVGFPPFCRKEKNKSFAVVSRGDFDRDGPATPKGAE